MKVAMERNHRKQKALVVPLVIRSFCLQVIQNTTQRSMSQTAWKWAVLSNILIRCYTNQCRSRVHYSVWQEGKLTFFYAIWQLRPQGAFPCLWRWGAPLQSQGKAPWGRGWLACVASVFARVRRESWDESSRSNFRAITRLETITTQATLKVIFRSTEGQTFYWSIYDSWWQHQMSVRTLKHDWPSGRFSFIRVIFLAVFDSRSPFFAPKLDGNAWYELNIIEDKTHFLLHCPSFSSIREMFFSKLEPKIPFLRLQSHETSLTITSHEFCWLF